MGVDVAGAPTCEFLFPAWPREQVRTLRLRGTRSRARVAIRCAREGHVQTRSLPGLNCVAHAHCTGPERAVGSAGAAARGAGPAPGAARGAREQGFCARAVAEGWLIVSRLPQAGPGGSSVVLVLALLAPLIRSFFFAKPCLVIESHLLRHGPASLRMRCPRRPGRPLMQTYVHLCARFD